MNRLKRHQHQSAFSVLIDTWWNVNSMPFTLIRFCACCFNRYMVECELTKIVISSRGCSVLIDTWWNVNLDSSFRLLFVYLF